MERVSLRPETTEKEWIVSRECAGEADDRKPRRINRRDVIPPQLQWNNGLEVARGRTRQSFRPMARLSIFTFTSERW
jgi:hypothetical protein